MKKHFLKSFALLAMLFSAITISAKQYCGEVMKSNIGWDGNYTLSVEKVSNTQSRLTITVADSETITGFYQFLIQNQGGGTASKQNFDPNDADFSKELIIVKIFSLLFSRTSQFVSSITDIK